jgi:diguanylate cyclase (GGDEF)-like protein
MPPTIMESHMPPSSQAPLIDLTPFRKPGLVRRMLPFASMAAFAEVSLALPPGPKSVGYLTVNLALLTGIGVAVFLVPWKRLPAWVTVLVPVAYVGAILTLILASGGSTAGLDIVVLLPLVWTALYHRRWESYVVVVAIVAAEVVTSLTPVEVSDVDLLRRAALWAAMSLLVSVGTHDLRDQLSRTLAARESSLRQTEALEAAAEELTTMHDSQDVLDTATRLAAQLVSRPGTPSRRAQYLRVEGSKVVMVAQYDEAGRSVPTEFPLAEHPNLREVVETGIALCRPLDGVGAGPNTQQLMASTGVSTGIYVPVLFEGAIDGILSVHVRDDVASSELFEYCKAIGHLAELALANARNHEMLEAQAISDELTGLANRRAFNQIIEDRPGRLRFCVLAIDLDGLKEVNDTQGHETGDALLVHVAHVLRSTMRSGDMLARVGGDEIAGLLFDADEEDGIHAASRMLEALQASPFRGVPPGVSIGVASGTDHSDGHAIYAAADAAMYRAKREGGRRYAVADSTVGMAPAG